MRVLWPPTTVREVWRIYEYIHQFNPKAAAHLADLALLEMIGEKNGD